MQLDGGDYIIRASTNERIRVSFAGDIGNAAADLATSGTHANLAIRDTPHSNFRATVEVPATADITVRLTGGNLEVAAITGNKILAARPGPSGFRSQTPMTTVLWTLPSRLVNLNAGPFGDSGSGLSPQLKWSGPGKYTLRASLGAGNLELKH